MNPAALSVEETIEALMALRQETLGLFVERRVQRPDGLPTRLQEHLLFTVRARGGLQVSEVSAMLGTAPATTSQLLTAMEQKGWLERAMLPEDRRRHRVALTPAGERLVAQMESRRRERLTAVLTALSGEERAQLVGLARRLSALMLRQNTVVEGI